MCTSILLLLSHGCRPHFSARVTPPQCNVHTCYFQQDEERLASEPLDTEIAVYLLF